MTDYIDYLEIWWSGFRLDQAPWHFGSQKLAAKYRELETAPLKKPELTGTAQKSLESSTTNGRTVAATLLSIAADAVMSGIEKREDLAELEQLQRKLLLEKLLSRKLLAVGYSLPRNPTDLPYPIVPDVFDPRFIDWRDSSISGNGLHYAAIRVVRLGQKAQRALAAPIIHRSSPAIENVGAAPKIVHAKRPGRPSVAPIVTEAYQTLCDAGKICESDSSRTIHKEIATWIGTTYPDKSIPKYEAVRRILKSLRKN